MFKGLSQQYRQKGSDFGPTCHYEAAGYQMDADERVFSAGETCVAAGRPLMICPIDGGFMPVEYDAGCGTTTMPPIVTEPPVVTIPPTTTPGCATVGKKPLAGQECCTGFVKDSLGICNLPAITPPILETCVGTWVCSIPDMYLYAGLGVLALMMMRK